MDGRIEGWMVSIWKERKIDRYWTDIWNGAWERREFLWTGSQISALPKPLGLGKFPRADPRWGKARGAGVHWEGTGWA